MDAIRLSVVVPTYRRPALLERCLRALALQDFPGVPFEIIVVSDGSDEQTVRVLSRFTDKISSNIRYCATPRKGGPAAARNTGWRMSAGELVAFTDDDCIPSVTWLRNFWHAYQAYGRPVAAFSGSTIVPIPMRPTDYERNISRLADAEFITANCACTRQALERVGGFDERFRMAWREDSDLQFKFIESEVPVLQVKSAIVTHPVRKARWGVSIYEERKSMFNALLYKKFPRLYREKITSRPSWLYYGIACSLLVAVIAFFSGANTRAWIAFGSWAGLTAYFAWKRLQSTVRTGSHVAEMIFTSAVIPFFSLYWNLYGAWKFRVLRMP